MEKIRLKDVALRAQVSPATVTRVVRGNGYVSPEKRAMVEKVLHEMGYSAPQAGAPCVLMLMRSFNPLFSRIAEAVGCAVQEQGWHLITHYLRSESPEELTQLMETLRRSNLKGIVCNCVGQDYNLASLQKYLADFPVPLVMVERSPDFYGLNRVMLHAKEMLFIAVRHLFEHGHRRIVYLGVEQPGMEETEQMRKAGFLDGAAALGLSEEAIFLPISAYTMEEGYRAMGEYVQKAGLPTAVIAADGVMVGVSNFLYQRGVRVPQDISLVGLDDTMAALATPPLTSVAFPVQEIAQNTVRILLEAQRGDALPQNVLLSTKLTDRGSVASPRK